MAKINGTDADEVLNGTSGDDEIRSLLGSDTINSGDGDDVIYEEGGLINVIIAGDGNDSIYFSNGIYSENRRDIITNSSIDAGAGDDFVQVMRASYDLGPLTIDLGSGNDLLVVDVATVSTTISTGLGVDHILLAEQFGSQMPGMRLNYRPEGHSSDSPYAGPSSTLVVTDFSSGAGGDVLDLAQFIVGVFVQPVGIDWDPSLNPFAEGYLSLVQDGNDTIVRLHLHGFPHGERNLERDIILLEGVDAASLIAENFAGYSPDGADLLATSEVGTSGNDVFTGTAAPATFLGLAGDDIITGNAADDTLEGGTGSDTILGGHGDDILRGGDDDDHLDGGIDDDLIEGGEGNDYILDPSGNDVINAGAGDDYILLDRPRNTLLSEYPLFESISVDAGDGNDLLHYIEVRVDAGIVGSVPNASLLVADLGAGDDVFIIEAPRADIVLTTGAGSDIILIEGSMRALSNTIRGSLTITDFTAGNGGDVLHVGTMMLWFADSNPFADGFLVLQQAGNDVLVGHDFDGVGGSDGLDPLAVLQNVDIDDLTAFNFAGWDPDLTAPLASTISGTAGADRIFGDAAANTIDASDGDDEVYGAYGNDTITGGAGNDILRGGYGDDYIDGGDGDDLIEDTGEGSDTLIGGLGNDRIFVNHAYVFENETIIIDAGEGDDVVEALAGESGSAQASITVDLGAGNDRYILNTNVLGGLTLTLGAGVDVVEVGPSVQGGVSNPIVVTDFEAGDGGDIFDAGAFLYFETFHFPFGNFYEVDGSEFYNPFAYGSAELEQVGDDVHLFVNASSNHRPVFVVFENVDLDDLTAYNLGIEFAFDTYVGTTGADNFSGSSVDDVIRGGNGNDILSGGAGFNVIDGGYGDDTIAGGDDGNVIFLGQGFDQVTTGSGEDIVVSQGTDNIDTGAGNDRIIAADPSVDIYQGPDPQYLIDAGEGDDEVWLQEGNFFVDLGAGNDELHVGAIGNLNVTLGAGSDQVYWDGYVVDHLSTDGSITFTDFETGDGGDVYVMPLGLMTRYDYQPFEAGAIEIRQDGSNTVLVVPSVEFGDHVFATFENTNMGDFTAFNFGGIEPVIITRTVSIEINGSASYASDYQETFVNPESHRPGPNPAFAFVPLDEGEEFIFDGQISVIGQRPGPVSFVAGISTSTGAVNGLVHIGEDAIIDVHGDGVGAYGIYASNPANIINDGHIEVTYVGTSSSPMRGVYYNGPYLDYIGTTLDPGVDLENVARFHNNGTLIVTASRDAEGVYLEDSGTLNNTGLISVHAGELAIGVNAEFRYGYLSVQNSGEIRVTSDSSEFLTIGIAIESLSDIAEAQTIINSGLIDAEIGVYVYFESGQDGIAQTLINSGEITGLVILNGGDDEVINSGTLHTRTLLEEGNDTYDGRDGFHTGSVEGGSGNDLILGGAGGERLFGDQGDDIISAGGGADFVEGGSGADLLDGGFGYDALSYLEGNQQVHADLATGIVTSGFETDFVRSFEDFVGSAKDDTILGASIGEFLYGNAGDDWIDGRGGGDSIFAGKGSDTLIGGAGLDTFYFETGDGHDEILDFSAQDRISVHGFASYQSLDQVGEDVRIVLSAEDSILVRNAVVGDFTSQNLLFDIDPLNIQIPVVNDQPFLVAQDLFVPEGLVLSITNPQAELLPYIDLYGSMAITGHGVQPSAPLEMWIAADLHLTTTLPTELSIGIFAGHELYLLETAHLEVVADAADHAFGSLSVGSVFNFGHIQVTNYGGDASGVAGTSGDGVFANNGTIVVTASGAAYGLGNSDSSGGTHQVFNNGIIQVEGNGASAGIVQYLSAHPSADQPVIVNAGDITVADDTVANDSAGIMVSVRSQVSLWNSGTITADYAIYADPISHSAVSDNWLAMYNSGTLNGDVFASSYGDTFINTGEVFGHVDLAGGDDLFDGREGSLTGSIDGADGNDTILAGAGSQTLIGGFGDDVLSGGSGADILTGNFGTDSFRIGVGFGADEITDFGINGDADFIDVEGYASYQSIVQQGDDVLITFSATDTLLVRNVLVSELTGGAIRFGAQAYAANTIPDAPAPVEVSMPSNVSGTVPEGTFPAIIGTDKADQLIGGLGPDMLIGLENGDVLDGRSGNDQMYGGLGDDSYFVDSGLDLIFENPDEGTDHIQASVSVYLHANVENLSFEAGAGDLFGVGNSAANIIVGNEGANLLLGGAGDDTLEGNGGTDSLFGEAGEDHLIGGAGVDYLVGGDADDVLDGGDDPDAIYGQVGNDTLIGGSSFHTDILVGGEGNDHLYGDSGLNEYDLLDGGSGDDTYYVDTGADLTFEGVGGGTDTVYADISNINNAGVYLYANVENLVLVGTTGFGVGNDLDNQLTGSQSANWLLGGAGNDLLNGGAGGDVLFGEAGQDTFVFEQGTGGDIIGDFTSGEDVIDLSAFGFGDFASLSSNFIQNADVGAINLANGDFIVLHNVQMDQLSQSDFVL